jgi:hypothetical protein
VRKIAAVLLVLSLLVALAGVGAAQEPEGSPVPSKVIGGQPGAPAGVLDVLWEQVYDGYGWWASQCFPDLGGCYHTADDFVNAETWSLDLIFVDGSGAIENAEALWWYIYPDGGGVPAGTPGDAQQFWGASLSPDDPAVTIEGGQVTVDLAAAWGGPLQVPAGHWWLIFYPEMYLNPYGQWGWYTGLPSQYYPAAQWIFGPPWVPQYPNMAFRLEGTAGQPEPDIEVTPESLAATMCPGEVTEQTLQVCNAGGGTLEWSLSEVPAPRQRDANGPDVLLLYADASASNITGLLQAYGDLGAIDLFDARYGTPALGQLQAYDAVVTWSNYVYADPAGAGDVLADYVDGGGRVINLMFAMGTHGNEMQGRFMELISTSTTSAWAATMPGTRSWPA